jgi:hypothetical protein
MAGTRTAPDVTGAVTAKQVVFKWIDVSGDKISESWFVPAAATQAQIEAFADAKQAASQASLYAVEVQNVFGSVEDASNAEEGEKSSSVFDALSITFKNANPEITSKRVQVQAPEGAMFLGDVGEKKDDFDPTNALLVAVMTTALALFGAGWSVVWGRYVEHKEVNEKINI